MLHGPTIKYLNEFSGPQDLSRITNGVSSGFPFSGVCLAATIVLVHFSGIALCIDLILCRTEVSSNTVLYKPTGHKIQISHNLDEPDWKFTKDWDSMKAVSPLDQQPVVW